MVGKRVQFDDETWEAIEALARDSDKSFQELADEAFADILKEAQAASRAKGRAQGEHCGKTKA